MLAQIVGEISNFMYGKLLIIMLIGVGLYYTLRTGFIQMRLFKETIRVILEKPEGESAVSSFQALMVSTASRVGTGNIVGISTAICLGGYGAIFWMWLIAVIGGARIFLTVSMVLFAFTTLLGNLYYVDNCFAYILRRVPGRIFKLVYRLLACLVIFVGAGSSMGLLWDIADVTMGFMTIINLPVICILGTPAMLALKDYVEQRRQGRNPVFKARSIGLQSKTDYWCD